MKDETDPVTPDEIVVRLVWKYHYKARLAQPVRPGGFEPKPTETDGVSVFRAACLTVPEQALDAIAPDKRDGYAIALLPVAELLALGLTVRLDPIESVPGHAVIPELNAAACQADPAFWRPVREQLAAVASRSVVREPKS